MPANPGARGKRAGVRHSNGARVSSAGWYTGRWRQHFGGGDKIVTARPSGLFNRARLIVVARMTIVIIVLPWAASLLTDRRGWAGGWPGSWNWLGLLVVAVGFSVFAWCVRLRLHPAPGADGAVDNGLVVSGPYRFSRNPMFLAVLTIWLGWTLFYGSISVAVGFAAIWAYAAFVVAPSEERDLEARFGEAYRSYKQKVPRWIGGGGA